MIREPEPEYSGKQQQRKKERNPGQRPSVTAYADETPAADQGVWRNQKWQE